MSCSKRRRKFSPLSPELFQIVIELLVATTNRGKFAEVESSLKYLPLKIVPLPSLENFPVVIEDGATYEENALKKARTLAESGSVA